MEINESEVKILVSWGVHVLETFSEMEDNETELLEKLMKEIDSEK